MNMSFSNIKTPILWKNFITRRKEIENTVGTDLFSVEVYKTASFFENFDPSADFEKWAAVKASDFKDIPSEMETLIIPPGKYAVFNYIGKGSDSSKAYQSIIQDWFPTSKYQMDHRPHFAVMGEKYKNEDPNSEEELWFPIIPK